MESDESDESILGFTVTSVAAGVRALFDFRARRLRLRVVFSGSVLFLHRGVPDPGLGLASYDLADVGSLAAFIVFACFSHISGLHSDFSDLCALTSRGFPSSSLLFGTHCSRYILPPLSLSLFLFLFLVSFVLCSVSDAASPSPPSPRRLASVPLSGASSQSRASRSTEGSAFIPIVSLGVIASASSGAAVSSVFLSDSDADDSSSSALFVSRPVFSASLFSSSPFSSSRSSPSADVAAASPRGSEVWSSSTTRPVAILHRFSFTNDTFLALCLLFEDVLPSCKRHRLHRNCVCKYNGEKGRQFGSARVVFVHLDDDERLVPLLSCSGPLAVDSSFFSSSASSSSSVLVSLSSGPELHWDAFSMASASFSCTDLAWERKRDGVVTLFILAGVVDLFRRGLGFSWIGSIFVSNSLLLVDLHRSLCPLVLSAVFGVFGIALIPVAARGAGA
ncbi:hypothetical protein EYF80_020541 [Liparis tanakae]|uniref:Transmembrane protein n=1 Tax=Liparis tanakae TaxID=230148 RepID=A0A4Z2HW32_9TELE|nr:hypothetical protein EYF80_020541 [Liparis tanakae]